jgi:sugar lactone lactonase YvrE
VAIATISTVLLGVTGLASGATGATAASGPVITTIAGGDGGPAPANNIDVPACGVSSGAGAVYVSTGNVAWHLNPTTDEITPVAGVGPEIGSDGNGVPGTTATLSAACGTAADAHGNLLIATQNMVRVVARSTGTFYAQHMIAGRIYTIAGTGADGFSGDDGPALSAKLDRPQAVAVDPEGNVVITDTGNDRVRVVAEKAGSFYGQSMKAGDIYTVFAQDARFEQAVVDRSGNLVIAAGGMEVLAEKTGRFYGQSMTAGSIYSLTTPERGVNGIALDGAGNVVWTDQSQVGVTAATNGTFYGQSMTAGGDYAIAGTIDGLGPAPNGVPALKAGLNPVAIAVNADGNVVITDAYQAPLGEVLVIAPVSGEFYGESMTGGDIYTVAGESSNGGVGELATSAEMNPSGAAQDASGNILAVGNFPGGPQIAVVAGASGSFYGQAMVKGHYYNLTGAPFVGGNPSPYPFGIVVDHSGNVIFTPPVEDTAHSVDILAEHTGNFYGQSMVAGQVYNVGPSSDFVGAVSMALDRHGNLIFTLPGPGAGVYVLAASRGTFYGRQLTPGQYAEVAGGGPAPVMNGIPANQAYLGGPVDTVVDSAGNLVIADAGADMIRVVAESTGKFYGQSMRAGYIYQVAGTGKAGLGANAVSALTSAMNNPEAVAVDAAGNLVIADTGNNMIRVVAVKSGTFYGQSMKAGYIYRIAGTGRKAFGGDGGAAIKASMAGPSRVTMLHNGDILVPSDRRLRLITP